MKLLHLADLHIGKSVNGFSMLEDQRHILDLILDIIGKERPDAVLIAGDVYDKPTPPAEAVALFDEFLTSVKAYTFTICGNHDSAPRLAFGGRLMEKGGAYMAPVYNGKIEPIVLSDEFGEVGFYLIPFLKPAVVRAALCRDDISTYAEAAEAVIASLQLSPERRNVAVMHQFVTGSEKSGAEETSVGGLDDIPRSLLQPFDYVALGHIHRPQNVGDNARYSGSPLKYSFSEAGHQKSVTIVDLGSDGIEISTLPLTPLRDMRIIKGSYYELTLRENYAGTNTGDYIRAVLTDADEIPDAIGRLRAIYPNIMELAYSARTLYSAVPETETEGLTPAQLFSELFTAQNGCEMTEPQKKIVDDMIESIWEGEL